MAQVTKRKFSGSTDGRNVVVVATASVGTTIHTAVTGTVTGTWDEVWIWATNIDSVSRLLTIQFGGTTSGVDNIPITIPPNAGPVLVVPGWILQNGSVVRAFGAAASIIMLSGYVNAITA